MTNQTARQPRTKKRVPRHEKFLLAGLLIDLLLVVAVLLFIGSAPIYECGRTFSILFSSSCTFKDLSDNLYYIAYYGTLLFLVYWWLAIPALISPPLIGYLLGKGTGRVKNGGSIRA